MLLLSSLPSKRTLEGLLSIVSSKFFDQITSKFLTIQTSLAPNPDLHKTIKQILYGESIDYLWIPQYKPDAVICDMDMTLVQNETLDLIAEYFGIKNQVESITIAGMGGSLTFEDSFRQRVKLFENFSQEKYEKAVKYAISRIEMTPGSKMLAKFALENNLTSVIATGGLTPVAEYVREKLCFDELVANDFLFENGACTGVPRVPLSGPEAKLEKSQNFSRPSCIGDGSNDMMMLEDSQSKGGLAVAFHAKEVLRNVIYNQINFSDLTFYTHALKLCGT